MEYLTSIFLLLSGFLILFLGGEFLVRSALRLAERWRVPSLFIGLTLVSIGTSAPELFASLLAQFEGKPNMALGNIIGSNIFNLLMILGFTALIQPLRVQKSLIKFEWVFLSLSALFFTFCLWDSTVFWYEGFFLFFFFVIFLVFSFYRVKKNSFLKDIKGIKDTQDRKKIVSGPIRNGKNFFTLYFQRVLLQRLATKYFFLFQFFILILGILFLSMGAKIALTGAIQMGKLAGISEAIIGVVIISIGTGLPELVTSIVAAFKSEVDLALSNVIGSNLMNTLGITSVVAWVGSIHLGQTILFKESLILLGMTFAFFLLFWVTKRSFNRKTGFFLLTTYAIYLWMLF